MQMFETFFFALPGTSEYRNMFT